MVPEVAMVLPFDVAANTTENNTLSSFRPPKIVAAVHQVGGHADTTLSAENGLLFSISGLLM